MNPSMNAYFLEKRRETKHHHYSLFTLRRWPYSVRGIESRTFLNFTVRNFTDCCLLGKEDKNMGARQNQG